MERLHSTPPTLVGTSSGSDATVAPGRPPALLPEQRRSRRGALALFGGLAAGLVGGAVGGSAATWYWQDRAPRRVVTIAPARASTAAPVSAELFTSDPAAAPAINGLDAVALFQAVAPSVVGVEVEVVARRGAGQGQGSGFIVTAEGHIVTNAHVVERADRVRVLLADGTRVAAEVVGQAPGSDLAVLQAKIPAEKLRVAILGDSDTVVPGEPVVAIGSPFGLDHSITQGIISALDRELPRGRERPLRGLIQTDAAINPGNSGGPLINARGEVVGVTTAIESPVRGSVGVGFAIPINRVERLLPRLAAGEKILYPWIGISSVPLTADLAEVAGLKATSGLLVMDVVPESPAAAAGLQPAARHPDGSPRGGDVVVEIDGNEVAGIRDLTRYLETRSVGDEVTLTVLRDGKRVDLPVTLGSWPT